MKVLKIILISLAGLIVVGAIGAYIFVKKAFTPDPNYLELTETSNYIPIKWSKSKESDRAALLLPVRIEGIPRTFYVQFDTGVPSTKLYKGFMLAIQEKYPDQIGALDSTSTTISQSFQLGDMTVHSDQFVLYDYGVPRIINWEDSTRIRIGTLGADILEKKKTLIDFKDSFVFFGDSLPDTMQEVAYHDMIFFARRTLFPAEVAGKKRKLIHDTGTSGFELITNKKTWDKLSKEGAQPEEAFKVKSWKRQLTAYNIEADGQIKFEARDIDLTFVTNIGGASFMQSAMMRMTGMGGMIGNQIFKDKILIMDCANKKYALLDSITIQNL